MKPVFTKIHRPIRDSPAVWCLCVFFPILPQLYVPFYVKKRKLDNFMCLLEFECAKRLKAHSQAIPGPSDIADDLAKCLMICSKSSGILSDHLKIFILSILKLKCLMIFFKMSDDLLRIIRQNVWWSRKLFVNTETLMLIWLKISVNHYICDQIGETMFADLHSRATCHIVAGKWITCYHYGNLFRAAAGGKMSTTFSLQ